MSKAAHLNRAPKKGEIVCPTRRAIVAKLRDDPEWRGGVYADQIGDEFGLDADQRLRVCNRLLEAGHIARVLERRAGRSGLHARYFAPAHKQAALEASAIALYEARKRALGVKVNGNRARRHVISAKCEAAALVAPVEAKKAAPKYVGEIVQCRSAVWAQPVQPAGFGALAIGSYLPGESWAATAFGAPA